MIEPFFFQGGSLFASYHPPATVGAERLVVVCPPLFEDYKRCYRFLYDLANGCASQGLHAIRFDYHGTGESQGELHDASVPRWISDIEAAIEEGTGLCGVEDVTLVAVRFGVTLASQVTDNRVIRTVAWDPVLDGEHYVIELDEMDRNLEDQHRKMTDYVGAALDPVEYVKFAIPSSLRQQIKELSVQRESPIPYQDLHVVATNPRLCEEGGFASCVFPGLEHSWTSLQDGLISLKPVLEGLVRKAMDS